MARAFQSWFDGKAIFYSWTWYLLKNQNYVYTLPFYVTTQQLDQPDA